MVHVGIDLGTSNTVVAITNSDGTPEIRMISGVALLPSVVYVTEDGGEHPVGPRALDAWADPEFDQQGTFRRWKLDMGDGVTLREMRFGGEHSNVTFITPELLTTWLVEHVLGELAEGVGGEEIESVLVTVPHGWRRENPEKCRATRQAAGRAVVGGKAVVVQPTTLSEPVAAAAYWLWAARQRSEHRAEDFIGKTILVCDVGGGTVDMSLVRIGPVEEPLVVEDAINNNYGGDFVTALIMSHVAKQFNAAHGTTLPDTAEGMLKLLGEFDDAWVRSWFLEAQAIQIGMSDRLAHVRPGTQARPWKRVSFGLPDGPEVAVAVGADEFLTILEPFFEYGRDLTRRLLERNGGASRPYAAVFAGGGSRIVGVSDRIVRPELELIVPNVDEVLGRITINDAKTDQAVAFGAALVANGIVQVQERLISAVGIESAIEPALAKLLGLPEGETAILLTPVLPRGATLPAVFRASEHSLPPWVLAAGEVVRINVVIDDDPDAPFQQPWEVKHPADGRQEALGVVIEADAEGVLSVTLKPEKGSETTVRGTLTRTRTGTAELTFTLPGERRKVGVTRISLEQLQAALQSARRGG